MTLRYGQTNHYIVATLFIPCIGLIGGCKTLGILPDSTTYPTDKRIIAKEVVALTPGSLIQIGSGLTASLQNKSGKKVELFSGAESLNIDHLQFEREIKVIGDSAEHETWILPENRREFSEIALNKKIGNLGAQICQLSHKTTKYVVSEKKYYYGTEATLRFSGIRTPAMKVVFRCALLTSVESTTGKAVATYSKILPYYDYFDIHEKRYTLPTSILKDKIIGALQDYQLKNIQILPLRNGLLIKAGASAEEIAISAENSFDIRRNEQIVMFIADVPGGSQLSYRLLSFKPVRLMRGVKAANTYRPSTYLGISPIDRSYSFFRSQIVLEKIHNRINSAS